MKSCVCALVFALGGLASLSATAAYVVPARGMAPVGVSPPIDPVNGVHCEAFVKQSGDYQRLLGEMHQDCLDRNKSCRPKRDGQCSCAACEGFHLAVNRFSAESAKEGRACFDAVAKNRDSIWSSLGSTSESMQAAQKALSSGANALVMAQVKNRFSDLIRAEISGADDAMHVTEVSAKAVRIADQAQQIRSSCLSQVAQAAAPECEKQALLAVRDFQDVATANNSNLIRTIQTTALIRLDSFNRLTLDVLNQTLTDHVDADHDGQTIGK